MKIEKVIKIIWITLTILFIWESITSLFLPQFEFTIMMGFNPYQNTFGLSIAFNVLFFVLFSLIYTVFSFIYSIVIKKIYPIIPAFAVLIISIILGVVTYYI